MRTSDLVTQYRKKVNPPYTRKDLTAIAATVLILIVLPLTVFAGLKARSLLPQAKTDKDVPVATSGKATFVSNELLIKFKKGSKDKVRSGKPTNTGIASINKINKQFKVKKFSQVAKPGKKSKKDADIFAWYKVTLEGKGEKITGKYDVSSKRIETSNQNAQVLQSLLTKYSEDPNIVTIEPNYTVSIIAVPNDPYYSSSGSWGQSYQDLYGMHKIQAEAAWDQTTGSADIIVADIDTGVDRNHEDLQGQMWVNTAETPGNGVDDDGNGYIDDYHGWDWANSDNDPMDDHGHGTHTVGTIAAVGNNGKGVVGVNWTSKIMALKFLNSGGSGSLENGAKALQYAADMGARVSSNSWGCGCQSTVVDDAIKYEHDWGMVIAVAAGNSGVDALGHSPASVDHAITVAASDYDDAKASFSNWGEKIDVAAPGVGILSLRAPGTDMYGDGTHIVDTKYYWANGTSMACPHVAGLAALLLAKNPSLTNEEIRQIIRHGADDLGDPGKDKDFGYGRINAANTLNLSSSKPLTPMITSPRSRVVITAATMEIYGSVSGPNFASYKVEMGIGRSPASWITVATATKQVISGLLATADVGNLNEGDKIIFKLTATDTSGKTHVFQVHDITVDNFETKITSPNKSVYGNVVDVVGTAQTKNGVTFASYTLDYREGNSSTWSTSGITLANGGTQSVVSGKLGIWGTGSLTADASYTLRLTVTSTDGRSEQVFTTVEVDKDVLPGWPKDLGRFVFSTPAVGDLDGDGNEEIIIAPSNQDQVFAFNKDGSSLSGWPVTLPSGIVIHDSMVVADVDGNGQDEVVIVSGDVQVLGSDGNNIPGWPQSMSNSGFIPSISAGDLDGDGNIELVAINHNFDTGTLEIYARHYDGTLVAGFPKKVFENATTVKTSFKHYYLNLSDLDGDGKLEIIIHPEEQNIDKVYVLDYQGNIKAGWPQTIDGYHVIRTLAGDITGNGRKEVIVYYAKTNIGGATAYVTVYDSNGVQIPSYPQEAARWVDRMGPALADVTGNGILDIVLPHFGVGSSTRFTCSPLILTKDGAYPYPACYFGNSALPAIVDFNGDESPNPIVTSGSQDTINVLSRYFDGDGKLGWSSIWKKSPGDIKVQPIVSDLDNNGKWEIVAIVETGNSSSMFVWEPAVNNDSSNGPSWGQYIKDANRSGTYQVGGIEPPTKQGDINGDGVVNIFDASILASRWGTADPDADLNGNGVVDIFDASILASNWEG